ncbi:MAG: ATP-dependent zinc protease, partial [Verrucomicrobiaceae bacterium]
RKLRGDFTLNNRSNMLAPVLIGRNMIKLLGWVDPGRTNLADQKILR